MPNRNYINGRAKEYRLINRLKDLGYDIVFRSAGSHSPIDVIGINQKRRLISLFQCKPDSMSQNKKNEIIKDNIWLNGDFFVTFEVY